MTVPGRIVKHGSMSAPKTFLQSVSPLPSTSVLWKLLAKLNTLRNAIAHGKEHRRLAQLVRELQRLISESPLGRTGDPDRPDWIVGFAFCAAVTDLDNLLSVTRLRKQIGEFTQKLPLDHILRQQTRGLKEMVRVLASSSILEKPALFE